jgi:hypothetical protein
LRGNVPSVPGFSGFSPPGFPPGFPGFEAERFNNAVSKAFTVSKEEMQRREDEWESLRGKKTPKK